MIKIIIHIIIHLMINIMIHLLTYIMTNIMTNMMINVMTAWKKVHSHSGQLSKKEKKRGLIYQERDYIKTNIMISIMCCKSSY